MLLSDVVQYFNNSLLAFFVEATAGGVNKPFFIIHVLPYINYVLCIQPVCVTGAVLNCVLGVCSTHDSPVVELNGHFFGHKSDPLTT